MGIACTGSVLAIVLVPKKEGCLNYSMVSLDVCLVLANRSAHDNHGLCTPSLCAIYIQINRIDHAGAIVNCETVFAGQVQGNLGLIKTRIHAPSVAGCLSIGSLKRMTDIHVQRG